MCFNSSKSESKQAQSTVTRDERLAADNGATVVSAKDGGTATTTVAQAQTAHNVLSAAPGSSINFQDVSPEVLAAAFDFAKGVTQGAGQFARDTQNQFAGVAAQYADMAANANTPGSQQFMQRALLVGGGIAVAYFFFKAVA